MDGMNNVSGLTDFCNQDTKKNAFRYLQLKIKILKTKPVSKTRLSDAH